MSPRNLRFNFGYLLEASPGTRSTIQIDYPSIQLDDVTLKPLQGEFEAVRTGEGILVRGNFNSNLNAECVRCLTDYVQPIAFEVQEIFYYPAYIAPPESFVIHDDGNADLGPLIREVSLLAMPMKPLCREDCLGLCDQCGKNLNEGPCECEKDDIDPRLSALKRLLEQTKE
ncbi:MAG: DUF177 domain-containing protein [Anaerolineales bacterium]|nr:DUF177 domain-containing protein [Anaerolineales bacterium]